MTCWNMTEEIPEGQHMKWVCRENPTESKLVVKGSLNTHDWVIKAVYSALNWLRTKRLPQLLPAKLLAQLPCHPLSKVLILWVITGCYGNIKEMFLIMETPELHWPFKQCAVYRGTAWDCGIGLLLPLHGLEALLDGGVEFLQQGNGLLMHKEF